MSILAYNSPSFLLRGLRLNFLKYIVKPSKKVDTFDVIYAAEHEMEKRLSFLYKYFLDFTGLKSSFVSVSYGVFHYYDSAPNSTLRPLIFIPGLGCSGQNLSLLGKMLANKTRVILLDLFNMGGYSKAKNSKMNFNDHIASLVEFIKKISPDKNVDLCGSSLGGWFIMALAAKEKNLVHKIILLNPAGVAIKPLHIKNTITHLNWKKFKSIYTGILKSFPFTGMPFISSSARRGAYRNLKRKGVLDLISVLKTDHFMDDFLSNIECQVLLLWGQEDNFLSKNTPQILMKNIKNIDGKLIENCAHGPALEAPNVCFKEINKFLNLTSIKNNEFAHLILTLGLNHKVRLIHKPTENGKSNDNE